MTTSTELCLAPRAAVRVRRRAERAPRSANWRSRSPPGVPTRRTSRPLTGPSASRARGIFPSVSRQRARRSLSAPPRSIGRSATGPRVCLISLAARPSRVMPTIGISPADTHGRGPVMPMIGIAGSRGCRPVILASPGVDRSSDGLDSAGCAFDAVARGEPVREDLIEDGIPDPGRGVDGHRGRPHGRWAGGQ